ncbi:hypothetical protein VNI00_001354 [Paramarasmius palmivorus]|uniref:Uncharacterized protein n=1 Tax=Paramarasmius palmivorus TaxID=297713 RepID=A0AAW0E5P2_9AGAR
MDSTQKFQAAFPTLLSASPKLAALHNARNLRDSASLQQADSCRKCGAFFSLQYDNQQYGTRLVRLDTKKRALPRGTAVQTTCGNCGWTDRQIVAKGSASLFQRRKSSAKSAANGKLLPENKERRSQVPPSAEPPAVITKKLSPAPEVAEAAKQTRNRPKKKLGLQEMLARNREKVEQEKRTGKDANSGSSLSAFLSGL